MSPTESAAFLLHDNSYKACPPTSYQWLERKSQLREAVDNLVARVEVCLLVIRARIARRTVAPMPRTCAKAAARTLHSPSSSLTCCVFSLSPRPSARLSLRSEALGLMEQSVEHEVGLGLLGILSVQCVFPS